MSKLRLIFGILFALAAAPVCQAHIWNYTGDGCLAVHASLSSNWYYFHFNGWLIRDSGGNVIASNVNRNGWSVGVYNYSIGTSQGTFGVGSTSGGVGVSPGIIVINGVSGCWKVAPPDNVRCAGHYRMDWFQGWDVMTVGVGCEFDLYSFDDSTHTLGETAPGGSPSGILWDTNNTPGDDVYTMSLVAVAGGQLGSVRLWRWEGYPTPGSGFEETSVVCGEGEVVSEQVPARIDGGGYLLYLQMRSTEEVLGLQIVMPVVCGSNSDYTPRAPDTRPTGAEDTPSTAGLDTQGLDWDTGPVVTDPNEPAEPGTTGYAGQSDGRSTQYATSLSTSITISSVISNDNTGASVLSTTPGATGVTATATATATAGANSNSTNGSNTGSNDVAGVTSTQNSTTVTVTTTSGGDSGTNTGGTTPTGGSSGFNTDSSGTTGSNTGTDTTAGTTTTSGTSSTGSSAGTTTGGSGTTSTTSTGDSGGTTAGSTTTGGSTATNTTTTAGTNTTASSGGTTTQGSTTSSAGSTTTTAGTSTAGTTTEGTTTGSSTNGGTTTTQGTSTAGTTTEGTTTGSASGGGSTTTTAGTSTQNTTTEGTTTGTTTGGGTTTTTAGTSTHNTTTEGTTTGTTSGGGTTTTTAGTSTSSSSGTATATATAGGTATATAGGSATASAGTTPSATSTVSSCHDSNVHLNATNLNLCPGEEFVFSVVGSTCYGSYKFSCLYGIITGASSGSGNGGTATYTAMTWAGEDVISCLLPDGSSISCGVHVDSAFCSGGGTSGTTPAGGSATATATAGHTTTTGESTGSGTSAGSCDPTSGFPAINFGIDPMGWPQAIGQWLVAVAEWLLIPQPCTIDAVRDGAAHFKDAGLFALPGQLDAVVKGADVCSADYSPVANGTHHLVFLDPDALGRPCGGGGSAALSVEPTTEVHSTNLTIPSMNIFPPYLDLDPYWSLLMKFRAFELIALWIGFIWTLYHLAHRFVHQAGAGSQN